MLRMEEIVFPKKSTLIYYLKYQIVIPETYIKHYAYEANACIYVSYVSIANIYLYLQCNEKRGHEF